MKLKLDALLAGLMLSGAMACATAAPPVKPSSGSFFIPTGNAQTATQGTVLEFTSTGQFKRALFAPLNTDSVAGLTFGPDKNLYIAVDTSTDRGHGYVLRYDLKRSKLGAFIPPSVGGLEMPIGGRFGPNGDYYLSNNLLAGTYDQLRRHGGQTGQVVSVFGTNLYVPHDVTFGPDGLLYVANVPLNSVYRFDPVDGSFVDEFIASGSGGLQGPGVMAFGPDGNFYITSGRTNSVLRYRPDTGEFIGAFASVDGLGVEGPLDLVFGPDGNMYVGTRGVASSDGAVLRFNGTTGVFIDFFIPLGSGLTVGSWGMLFVDPGCSRYADNGLSNRCFPNGRARR